MFKSCLFLLLVSCGKLFAASEMPNIDVVDKIADFVKSPIIEILCGVALAIVGVSVVLGLKEGQEGVLKKGMGWASGVAVVLASDQLTGYMFNN